MTAVDFLVLGASIGNNKLIMSVGLRPLGVHKVAWIARKHDYNALAISELQLLSENEIFDVCKKFVGPKTLIGIGTTLFAIPNYTERQRNTDFSKLIELKNAVDRLRALYNNKLVLGGQSASRFIDLFKPDLILEGLSVENEIPKILDKHFRNGIQKKPYDWTIQNCDFSWHKTDFVQPKEALPIETGRGCIFKCKFCGYAELGKRKGTYEKNINNLKNYILDNYEKYGTTHYMLMDDTFNDSNERMIEWCEMVESLPFKIKYGGYVRLDLMYRYQDTTKRLYENGLSGCSFGVETFHPVAAKAIGKSFSAKHAKEFLDYIWEVIFEKNVFIMTTNLVGLPGESLESSIQAHEWYKQRPYIRPIWSAVYLTKNQNLLLSPSEFSKEPEKYGYQFSESDHVWKNEFTNYNEAAQLAMKFNTENLGKHSIDCWSQIPFFSQKNMEPKDFFNMPEEEKQKAVKNIEELLKVKNQNYFNAIRNFSV